jgi:hypothetical protein
MLALFEDKRTLYLTTDEPYLDASRLGVSAVRTL